MINTPLNGAKADRKVMGKPQKQVSPLARTLEHTVLIVFDVLLFVAQWLVGLIKRLGGFIWKKTKSFREKFFEISGYIVGFFIKPFLKPVNAWKAMKRELSKLEISDDESSPSEVKRSHRRIVLKHLSEFVFGKNGLAVTIFNCALPIVSVVFLFSVITYATNINYAVKLTVNGKFIGYIENELVFTDAELVMDQRMNYLGSATSIELVPEYSIEKIGYSETLTKYQVADLMLQNSGISVEYAYGIYINDVFYGAVADNSRIKTTLDNLLKVYDTGNAEDTVAFVDDIRYEDAGLYLTQSIIDDSEIINRISGLKTVSHFYTVEYGDSHTLVGDKLDMTQAQLEALNPGFIENDLHVGDQIKLNLDEPYLSVSITTTENYDEEVGYETEYIDDASLYEGVTSTYREGTSGIENVTARVSYVNGYEIKRTVISKKAVSAPISEIISVGTKPTPAGTYSSASAAYGKFIWPVNGGYISEYTDWDGGYYGHKGIDIAAPYGTAIYAGASGTVTLASSAYYGYGKCIMILHDNGLTTLYAHCSQIYVTEGQKVTQGECIAAVGETGIAYGCHCHFEVRSGSTKMNPIAYISK